MDSELKWLVVGFVGFFGMLIGAAVHSDRLKHEVQMECIKHKGEYIEKVCIFRSAG
jgi:hypothetical protein